MGLLEGSDYSQTVIFFVIGTMMTVGYIFELFLAYILVEVRKQFQIVDSRENSVGDSGRKVKVCNEDLFQFQEVSIVPVKYKPLCVL